MTVVFLKNSVSLLAHQEVARSKKVVERQEQGQQTSYLREKNDAVVSNLRMPEIRSETVRTTDQAEKLADKLIGSISGFKEQALAAHSQSQGKRALDFLHL